MRSAKLSRLIQLALVPSVAVGLSIGAQAQNSANDSSAHDSNTNASQQTYKSNDGQSASSSRSAQTSGTHGATQNTPYRGARASELIGQEVRNPSGQNLGKINDLVVDMNSGKVRYAILEFDPGIFEGERLFGVPVDQLRVSPRDDQVVYDMTRSRLEQAPEPSERSVRSGVTDMGVADRDAWERGSPLLDRNDAWQSAWRDPAYQRRLRASSVDRETWYDASDDSAYQARLDKIWGVTQPSDNPRAYRLSDLIGKDIRTPRGEEVGEIQDVVLNMANEKVHYVVTEFDPGWASPERRYVFPLSSFRLSRSDDDAVLDIDKSRLQSMRSFPENGFRRMNDRSFASNIDHYLIAIFPMQENGANDQQAGSQGSSGKKANDQGRQSARMASSDNDAGASASDRAGSDDVAQAWNRYDRNSDGHISRSEFERQYPSDADLQSRSSGSGDSSDMSSQRASSGS